MDAVTPERWRKVAALFERALDLPAADRQALLDRECPDPALRREVDRLLRSHHTAGDDFLSELDTARAAALLETAEEEDPPEAIGPYRIVRRIGGGGMGTVYLAHDPRLDRAVAVKLLRRRSALGAARDRLIDEARAAAGIDHPNTVPLHEVGETSDGRLYLAMAYAGDRTLADLLRRGPLPTGEAVAIAARIADALAAAHRLGIVHRDVKPSNVILSDDGRPRLVDFGIAAVAGRDSSVGATTGTLPYMSPEQTRRASTDHRTDVWSLGVVLYEMLTGRRPFRGDDAPGLIRAIREQEPRPLRDVRPDVPSRLADLVERCLARDPVDRPAGAEAIARELDEVASQLERLEAGADPAAAGVSEPGTGPGRAVPERSRRRIRFPVAAAVVAVAVAGAIVMALRDGESGERGPAASNTVAVLPFTPVDPDPALERLGRQLVVTLSSRLGGLGGVRVVEPGAVLGREDSPERSDLPALAAFARELGAGRLVYGRLTRSGDAVRLDATLLDTESMESLGHAVGTAAASDIAALTDSAALGLLRAGVGADSGLQLPARSAMTTSSVDALQAFLEGELAIAGARFRAAPGAFARAIAADSTFWLAYWRYMYARSYHGLPMDSGIRATVYEHRASFPEADRLLVEARMATTERERLALRRAATDRYPTYWPAWFDLGDQLIHHGVFLGLPFEEARTALERAVQLNPRFVPAWTHLFWIATHQRDTAATGAILHRFRELRLDSLMADEWGLNTLGLYESLDRLARTGGEPDGSQADEGARMLAGYNGPLDPERLAVSFANYGFFRAQLDMARRVRLLGPRPGTRAAQDWSDALAWSGRGRWESAFGSLRRYVRAGTRPEAPLWAYGLAATGAWGGVLPADSARALRSAALRSATNADGRAEVAWLDGLLACAAGDGAALAEARRRVAAAGAESGATLQASLAAMASALDGRTDRGGAMLAELELSNADSAWAFRFGARHPFVASVNRIAAAHWLLEAGDTIAAAPLLRLHETDLPGTLHPLPTIQVVLGTHLLPRLASVLERQGRPEEAASLRAVHAERADRSASMPPLRPCSIPPAGSAAP